MTLRTRRTVIIDSDGEVTITPRAAGTAKLTASGGMFSQEISVEVKP